MLKAMSSVFALPLSPVQVMGTVPVGGGTLTLTPGATPISAALVTGVSVAING